MTRIPQNPDVIVVGAGTAGLSAARVLRRSGIEVLVLEAAGHIGGRCVTDTATFSQPFDRGGSWLHSATLNPLARVAETQGVTLHKTDWVPTWARVKGHALSASELAAYCAEQKTLWDFLDKVAEAPGDMAIADALPQTPWRKATEHHISHMLGGDADAVSVQDSYNYAEGAGDWIVAGGLGAFVAGLHRDVPVRLNCPVTKIDTRGAGAEVTTPVGVIRAKQVIVTVSTGVLAAESITFAPPLPDAKLDAIDMLPNGLLNKVGIEFEAGWRGAQEGECAEILSDDETFSSIAFGFYGSPLATAFVGGRCAAALEDEGAGAATDYCLSTLKSVFGADITKSIVKTDETAWLGDPLTRGAYSFAKPGGATGRAVLAAPVQDRLFFAGEATMTDSYSTVHGAYQSGEVVAAQVLACHTA